MTEHEALHVYWRPGCAVSGSLMLMLRRRGIPLDLHNIWDDPDAATAVRRVADGNETVPTVRLGDRFLVNPTVGAAIDLVTESAPYLLDREPPPQGRQRRRWWRRGDSTSVAVEP